MAVPFASADPEPLPPLAPVFLEPGPREPGRHLPPPPQPASQQPPSPAAISGEVVPMNLSQPGTEPKGSGSMAAAGPHGPGHVEKGPLIVVDGANVVGSVPDGWWRDRAGAAARLRDNLASVPAAGLSDVPAPVEVVLVVEGRARDVAQAPGGVRVERATGSGDDKIIDLVRATVAERRTIVITADRGLRERALALGAEVRGPSAVPR